MIVIILTIDYENTEKQNKGYQSLKGMRNETLLFHKYRVLLGIMKNF